MYLIYADTETFSSQDLSRVGAARYAEDAQIILWSYAENDEPAKVWDRVSNPQMPADLKRMWERLFADPDARVVMHNGMNFDRQVFASNGFGEIPAEKIIDTMVLAYEHALPGSLEQLCEAFRLDADHAKDKDGKRLIQIFCKPLPKNYKLTRATPQTHPAEWERFKNYARLDIESMRAIYKKLPKWNATAQERRLQALDAVINSRGMCIDLELAKGAVETAARHRTHLAARTQKLTGGAVSAATQRDALLEYLRTEWGLDLASATRAEVEKRIAEPGIPEPVKELLRIRIASTKISVQKFQSVLNAACEDGRLRGCLQFRGASRTGRFCLTGDHEVLTPNGWVRLDQWSGGRIAVWNKESEAISFQDSEALAFDYTGAMYVYDSVRCAQICTPDHRMPFLGKDGRWKVDTVEHLAAKGGVVIPFTGFRKPPSTMDHDLLRVLIMTQADGRFTEDGQVVYNFKKARKVERCKMLLRRVGVPFVADSYESGVTRIAILSRFVPLWLRLFKGKEFGFWLFNESSDVIFDELPEWDGYRCGPNSIQYCTKSKHNADLIQALAVLSGRTATCLIKKPAKAHWSDCYAVNIWSTPGKGHRLTEAPTTIEFDGRVYCAKTPTGFFVVRRNGRVWVTGNSGRIFQPQNLARPTMRNDEIEFAIEATKGGLLDTFYEDPMPVLSNLLRGLIIAPKGKKLVVADYSNVEGRVLAWLAGEEWKLKAFRDFDAGVGHDLYKLTYARAFNVKPETVTKAQRQMGKVLELGMGYGGGAGAFRTFALAYGIDLHDMADAVKSSISPAIWAEACEWYPKALLGGFTEGMDKDVFLACDSVKRAWRKANAQIVQFWYDMDAGVRQAVIEGGPVRVGRHITVDKKGNYLRVRLPSGRYLIYPSPRIDDDGISYFGVAQVSRKWARIRSWGGKFVENVTQAAACDLLCEALLNLEAEGYQTVLTVHDEAICEVPDTAEFSAERMEKIMCRLPKWAAGLPLAAAGFESLRYRKD